MTDIGTLVGERAAQKAIADAAYRRVKEIEYELYAALREKYPQQWKQWEKGIATFKAEGVTVPVSRSYDINALRAEIGEDYPEIFSTETKIVEKVDGRKLTELWKQADMQPRLTKCVLPPTPKVQL